MIRSKTPENRNLRTQAKNRMPFKCQAQRNCLIRKQVSGLIKKQLKTFFAKKKIEKQVQQHNKDFIVVDQPSPMEKAKNFRIKQKENNLIKLQKYQAQYEKKSIKVSQILQEKKQQLSTKSSENLKKMIKVKNNFQKIMDQNYTKTETLKNSFLYQTSRAQKKPNFTQSRLSLNESRVSTAQQISRQKQAVILNSYMKKMKEREQRSLRKELQIQKKKQQAMKNNVPKCFVNKRNDRQQELMQKWENLFDSKFSRFEKSREQVLLEKSQKMFNRTMERNQIYERAWEKKFTNEEMAASRIISAVEKKIKKIEKIAKSRKDFLNRSQLSLNRNVQNLVTDYEKQKHNEEMRAIYNVLRKLKTLNDTEQLSNEEIQLLKKNLDSQDSEYAQIVEFVSTNRIKFFDKKQKEEEQKTKKKGKKWHSPFEK